MGDLFAWLISFFLLVAILGILLYQLMCLADLEYDYINPYDSASQINKVVLPEYSIEGALCFLHLITGHWVMFLLCLPSSCYNAKLFFFADHTIFGRGWFKRFPVILLMFQGTIFYQSLYELRASQFLLELVDLNDQYRLCNVLESGGLNASCSVCDASIIVSPWQLYSERRHLVDVTEIFNQLTWEKKLRLYKLGYLVIILTLSIFWMIWSIVDE